MEKCLWVHYAYARNAKLTGQDRNDAPYQGAAYLLIVDDIISQLDAVNGKITNETSRNEADNKIEANIIGKYKLKTTALVTYSDNQLVYSTITDNTSLKDLIAMLLETACMY